MDAAATKRFVKTPVIQREVQSSNVKKNAGDIDALGLFNSIKKGAVYFL